VTEPASVTPLRPVERTLADFNLTELGNAERLVLDHGDDVRFVPELGWHVWDGRRWRPDWDGELMRRAKATVRRLEIVAGELDDDDERKRILTHALRSEARAKLENAVKLAETDSTIIAALAALDAQPWLLNVANGTLSLDVGEIEPHDRTGLITKLAPVRHDPDATAPRWLAFLDRVFAGDQDLIGFVRRATGYTLTGSTAAQAMFVLYGVGANGKSTFIETLRSLLGDYGQQAPAEMLMRPDRKRSGPAPEIVRLVGARFVAAVETGDGQRLDEPLIKTLTGGDTIAARGMYEKRLVEFTPTHKLWLATNHKPRIDGVDDAIWRRVHLIPFNVTIPESERDPRLLERLCDELPGILNWALAGLADYRHRGHKLAPPEIVRAATATYRAEMDPLGDFLDECCTLEPNAATKAGTLYNHYTGWSNANGEQPLTGTAFGRRLSERFTKEPRRDGKWYLGISLQTTEEA
jgi:putative DNA primase/helicase